MEFTPAVNQAAEFLEISNDFTSPKEVVREAIIEVDPIIRTG